MACTGKRDVRDVSPGLHFEAEFIAQGISLIAGLDEAGRGAWAGRGRSVFSSRTVFRGLNC